MDYSQIQNAFTFTELLTFISSIAVALALVHVSIKGAKIVLQYLSPPELNLPDDTGYDPNYSTNPEYKKSYDENGIELIQGSTEHKAYKKRMGYD